MNSTAGQMSVGRRALIGIALMAGFYLIVLAWIGGFLAITCLLIVYTDSRFDSLGGLLEGVAFYFFITSFPTLRLPIRPGARIDAKGQPELFERLTRIARKLDREMPAVVVLTDDMNAGVAPCGGIMGIGSKWMLFVGLPLIQVHTISELDATLAHEFGHYHGGDTKLVLLIRGTQSRINDILGVPGWYRRMFTRITGEMFRMEESTADRLAAEIAGSDVAISGLKAIGRARDVADDYFAWDVLPVVRAGFIPPVAEGFAARLSDPSVIASMDKYLEERLSRESVEPGDTHPPLPKRIAAVKDLPPSQEPDNRPALSLLRNLPELEHRLIKAMFGVKRRRKLKPLAWKDAALAVDLPGWKDKVEKHEGLKGSTLQDLPALAIAGPDVHYILGAALACCLHRAGWTLESGPRLIAFKKDTMEMNPFRTIKQLTTREEWTARLALLQLDPAMPLCGPPPSILSVPTMR